MPSTKRPLDGGADDDDDPAEGAAPASKKGKLPLQDHAKELVRLQAKHDALLVKHGELLGEVEELRVYKIRTAARLAFLDLRVSSEAAPFKVEDDSTWDSSIPKEQKAQSRALEKARAGIVRACAQRLGDGSCTASQAKHVIILGDLMEDYFKLTLSEHAVAAKDLRPILAMLPTWAASKSAKRSFTHRSGAGV